jgi:hypothetical protein
MMVTFLHPGVEIKCKEAISGISNECEDLKFVVPVVNYMVNLGCRCVCSFRQSEYCVCRRARSLRNMNEGVAF